jgi:hypothetical protein
MGSPWLRTKLKATDAYRLRRGEPEPTRLQWIRTGADAWRVEAEGVSEMSWSGVVAEVN